MTRLNPITTPRHQLRAEKDDLRVELDRTAGALDDEQAAAIAVNGRERRAHGNNGEGPKRLRRPFTDWHAPSEPRR